VAGFGVSNVWHSQASHFCSALARLSEDPAGRFQTPNELLKAMPRITAAIDARLRITRQSLQRTPSADSRAGSRKLPAKLGPKQISIARLPEGTSALRRDLEQLSSDAGAKLLGALAPWNLPSSASVARCIMETYLWMFYFGVQKLDEPEGLFRAVLSQYHAQFQNVDIHSDLPEQILAPMRDMRDPTLFRRCHAAAIACIRPKALCAGVVAFPNALLVSQARWGGERGGLIAS
jgi:hypothetical protein